MHEESEFSDDDLIKFEEVLKQEGYGDLESIIQDVLVNKEINIKLPRSNKTISLNIHEIPELEKVGNLVQETIQANPGIEGFCLQGEGFNNQDFFNEIRSNSNISNTNRIEVSESNLPKAAESISNQTISKVDRLYLSISTDVADDFISQVFPRGTVYPAETKTVFHTVFDDQEGMSFKFCEGERIRFSKNSQVGSFRIQIPKRLAGEVKVVCKFILDENGILHAQTQVIGDNLLIKK